MKDNKRINSFHYFRGIAIIFIVAGHALYQSGWMKETIFHKLVANLILGGTGLFVFISSFLFHHIYCKNFNYPRFIKGKIRNILLPYLVFSLIPALYYSITGNGPYKQYIFSAETGFFSRNILPFLRYIFWGRTAEGYWYIPFIMVIFLAAPLFLKIIRMPARFHFGLFGFTLLISLFLQRPAANIAVWQSVVYFFPVFLLGMIISVYQEIFFRLTSGKDFYFFLFALLFALLQTIFYPGFGNLHKPAFAPALPDIMLLQKISLCLFFTVFLRRFETRNSPVLSKLADTSFAVYFLHPWILALLEIIKNINGFKINSLLWWIFLVACSVIISVLIIQIYNKTVIRIKTLFKSNNTGCRV